MQVEDELKKKQEWAWLLQSRRERKYALTMKNNKNDNLQEKMAEASQLPTLLCYGAKTGDITVIVQHNSKKMLKQNA